MTARQEILELIQPNIVNDFGDSYGVHVNWGGNIYIDFDNERLIDQVINAELASLQMAISNLDVFDEDHAGELQELISYRDYLTGDINP